MCNDVRSTPRIAVLYEHPTWFDATFAEFERRGVTVERRFAPEHTFHPAAPRIDVDLVLERAASAKLLAA